MKELVAVYGTLKKDHYNHSFMDLAKGKLVDTDFIRFDKLGDCGFPMVKLSNDSDKWLQVEIYSVPKDGMEYLDGLEGFEEGRKDNLYNRKKIITENFNEVWIYEINRDVDDFSSRYFKYNKNGKGYYIW